MKFFQRLIVDFAPSLYQPEQENRKFVEKDSSKGSRKKLLFIESKKFCLFFYVSTNLTADDSLTLTFVSLIFLSARSIKFYL